MANTQKDKKTPTVVPTAEEAKELIPANNVAEDQGQGLTTVADQVVAKVAGLAIKEIPGVYDLGNSAARALGGFAFQSRSLRKHNPGYFGRNRADSNRTGRSADCGIPLPGTRSSR